MKVIPFEEKYRQDFINFNTDWIISNFGFLEEHDKETFEKMDEEMEAGAMIFFAVENDVALATCMAMPMEGETWEICKLGSNKNVPHKGAGSAVFEAAMQWALNHGAKRLFILSNSKLKPALHIYEKYGFKEIKLENYEYARGDIAFEYKNESTEKIERGGAAAVFTPPREDNFWKTLDELVRQSKIVIDRPKGTAHPKFPDFIYKVDYGYLENTSSMDGAGIDVWVGTKESKSVDSIMCIVDLMKKDSEIKILIGCTEEEKEIIYKTHNETQYMKGILIER